MPFLSLNILTFRRRQRRQKLTLSKALTLRQTAGTTNKLISTAMFFARMTMNVMVLESAATCTSERASVKASLGAQIGQMSQIT